MSTQCSSPQDIFSEVVLRNLQTFGAELEAAALAAESLFPAVNSHPTEMLLPLQDLISVLKALILLKVSAADLQKQMFWGLIFWCMMPGLGSLVWGMDPLLFGENL